MPELSGDARAAVEHRGGHLQIIAAAGSGKTEVVSQRIAGLIADGVAPSEIAAFTFTRKAADELKLRVTTAVVGRLGESARERLGPCFVGTIHSWCFEMLRRHDARYEQYELLDGPGLVAFLVRDRNHVNVSQFGGPNRRLYIGIDRFIENVDVVDNELIAPERLRGAFGQTVTAFHARLERYRFLTFGRAVALTAELLRRPDVRHRLGSSLRHLVVDEYQDIDPAQEQIIAALADAGVTLCVVGDDDQAIYEWRGANAGNIITFASRYPGVARFEILDNYRSRPDIVTTASSFAGSIGQRLPKVMRPTRNTPPWPAVQTWRADTEQDEAKAIADTIVGLTRDRGYRYGDIAILLRGRVAMGAITEALSDAGVPTTVGGSSGIFDDPVGEIIARLFCWLGGVDWEYRRHDTLDTIVTAWSETFGLDRKRRDLVARRLLDWEREVSQYTGAANFIRDLYALLADSGIAGWDLDDPNRVAALAVIARFTQLIADFEKVVRRSRRGDDGRGIIEASDRGHSLYHRFATFLAFYLKNEKPSVEEPGAEQLDAVHVMTIHQSKGLQWPVVFVPSLTATRLPPGRVGRTREWLIDERLFSRDRYEGTDDQERRLFYVAMTRAREWLSISAHRTPRVRPVRPSPYLLEVAGGEHALRTPDQLVLPVSVGGAQIEPEGRRVSFSELAAADRCGLAHWYRDIVGLRPALAVEMGYGRAVHHLLRLIAEDVQATGRVPSRSAIEDLLEREFYLPFAPRRTFAELSKAARRLIDRYVADHRDELHSIWATERPFELHLDGLVVTGRADVVIRLDRSGSVPQLAIADYKTAAAHLPDNELQIQTYAAAAAGEGLDVVAGWIHDLPTGRRAPVPLSDERLRRATDELRRRARRLDEGDYRPRPGEACRRCDVARLCRFAVVSTR